MPKDLAQIIADWPAQSGSINVRKFKAADGEIFIQLRVDLGVLQMALDGCPDREHPFGCDSVLDYLREQLQHRPEPLDLSEPEEQALAREMLQYYHRRITLIALAKQAQVDEDLDEADACYRRAIRDADHNLAILNFLEDRCISSEVFETHEQYRPFILMHRSVCLAERALLVNDADGAVEHLKLGISTIKVCLEQTDVESDDLYEALDAAAFLEELRCFERQIRKKYRLRRTLREQLDDAIAAEDFERAAELRDTLAKHRYQQ